MIKGVYYKDEESGEVFDHKQMTVYEKLWNPRLPGGMIKFRNYHHKGFADKRLYDVIKDKSDLSSALILAEFIVKNTNRIGRLDGKGFASVSDIGEILNLSANRVTRFLNRMIRLRILAKITTETSNARMVSYAFNPVYVLSCKYIPLDLYVAFQEDINEVIPEWMKARYIYALNDHNVKESKSV